MASTRDQLIAAALDLLDHGGPKAVTLRAVAERVGVSHNAPYKHFASKEALLAAVAARELLELSGVLDANVAGPMALDALLSRYIDWGLRYPERFRMAFGRWELDSPELGEAAGQARAVLNGAVAEAQRRGRVRDGEADAIGALIQATLHGALEMELNGHLSEKGKHGLDANALASRLLGLLAPL